MIHVEMVCADGDCCTSMYSVGSGWTVRTAGSSYGMDSAAFATMLGDKVYRCDRFQMVLAGKAGEGSQEVVADNRGAPSSSVRRK